MYKIKIECEKHCDVLLSSNDDIKTLENNGAKITIPDEIKVEPKKGDLTDFQIKTLIKALESINTQHIQKSQQSSDKCLSVQKLHYESYSCYVDSVLFTLFSFLTPFCERYLLHPNIEEIEYILENEVTIGVAKLNKQQIQKVIEYIRKINLVLIDINKHFRGVERMDYCRTLRPVLLKDPLMILQEKPEYVFAKKNQEDAGELVQALFKTFFVNTLLYSTIKSFSNSKDSNIPEIVRSAKTIESAPFLIYLPDQLQSSELVIGKTTTTKLDIDDYHYGNQQTNSKYQMNLAKIDELKRLQQTSILIEMLSNLQKNKKQKMYTIPKYTELINLLLVEKIDEIIKKYSLEQLNELYRTIRDNADTYFTNTLFPLIKKLKTNPKSPYVKIGEEIVSLHSVFYDTFIESENYKFKSGEENKFLVINVKRFEDIRKKDNRSIEIPTQLTIADTNLLLNQIIVHSGASVSAGHYTVRFRCNDNWYLYNDIGPEVKQIGSFKDLVSEDSDFVKKNCALLIYSSINQNI